MEDRQEKDGSTKGSTSAALDIPPYPLIKVAGCSFPIMTEERIKKALTRFVQNHPGYRKKFIKQMLLTDITTEVIFIYKLETFGELRTKNSSTKAYSGGAIDDSEDGSPPRIWDIPVKPQIDFKDSEVTVKVPHTESLRRCTLCDGRGVVKCLKCRGSGTVFCTVCQNNGPQMFQGDQCIHCRRWGYGGLLRCCEMCNGNKRIQCLSCEGRGLVVHFETVTVTWLNKLSEVSDKDCNIPLMKLVEAEGKIIICEEKMRLQPLRFRNSVIALKSQNVQQKHQGAFPSILKQRHSLRMVPVTTARYVWKGKSSEFYIYGFENKVHFPDFPSKWTPCCIL